MGLGGRLIVIEGPDHVGRSLHCRLLANRLEAHGVAVAHIGLARSQLLGELIKSNNAEIHQLNWRTRSLLYATDLHDQIRHEIEPLLGAGFVVIADRYTLTPIVREEVRNGNTEWIKQLYSGVPVPDMSIILHAGPRRLLNRILFGEELQALNHFEAGMDITNTASITSSFLTYQRRIRRAFLAHGEEAGLPMIATRDSVEQVHEEIWSHVLPIVGPMLQPV